MLTIAAQTNLLVIALLVYATTATLRVGLFSVAPVGFAACGGYGTAILMTKADWSFAPTLFVVVLGTCVVGALIALPILRLTGIYAALATLAFLIMLGGLVVSLDVTGGSLGLYGIPAADVRPLLLGVIGANVLVWYWVDHSRWGRRLDSVGEAPVLAAAFNINVPLVRLACFGYSAMLGAIAGSAYAHAFYVVSPDVFGFAFAISVAALAVIAGPGHWLMPLVSTLTVGVIPIAFPQLNNWGLVMQGVLMTLVVVVYPDGLSGMARSLIMPRRSALVVGRSDCRSGVWAWL